MDMAGLDSLLGLEPEHRFIEIPRVGWVEIRELDGLELMLCYTAALIEDPVTGTVTFDPALHSAYKIASSLVAPSLGESFEDRIQAVDKVRSLPGRAYERLSIEVEKLTAVSAESVNRTSTIIDSVPFLYEVLDVLSEKGGWMKDLEGKTVSEFRTWVAFHRSQRTRTMRALEDLS
jgi:hypothetical protein